MERLGMILLSIWLILTGAGYFINLGALKNPVLFSLLQLLAGIFILIGLWPIFN